MKPKNDWVDKLIDSGLTGHKPKKKAKHRCRFEWPRVSDSWGNVQKTCRCGRRKGRL